MSYKAESLFALIEMVNKSLFLPHIQRPFVWEEEQMLRLFDSLMRNYPIQTLLFWRTKDEIKARKFMQTVDWDEELHSLYDKAISDQGKEKLFVLDGQQRLQSLFAMFNGSIQDDAGQREAWFDVVSGDPVSSAELKFTLAFASASPGQTYYRLRDLLGKDNQKNNNAIAKELNSALDALLAETAIQREERKERVRDNISQLVSLMREEKHFWIQTLDGVANDYPYRRILEIFVRVNSGGTKLDASDLMFAAMKSEWDEIEEKIEETVNTLNSGGLQFDKSVALKCLVIAHGAGAELSPEKFNPGQQLNQQIEADWDKAEATFRQLGDFITNDIKLYSHRLIRSYNSFVVIFDYLYHNPKPDPLNRARLKAYFYKSQCFNWFSSGTDSKLDSLHKVVGKAQAAGFPLSDVCRLFGKSALDASDMLLPRLRSLLLNLIYVEKHGHGPFNVRFKDNLPQADHIYPQSQLRSKLALASSDINHIGNFRFIGASDNNRKRAELPDAYFQRLKKGGVDIEKHLMVKQYADDPSKLMFDVPSYMAFRDARFSEILAIAERVVNPVV
jgi:hypothetical protein